MMEMGLAYNGNEAGERQNKALFPKWKKGQNGAGKR
jgi:hypothetical protein